MQLRYVFSELGQGLRRNLSMHLAVILTLFVSLTLVGLGVLFHLQADKAADHWGSQLQIQVSLCTAEDSNPACVSEVTDAQRDAITAVIDENPEAAGWDLETKDEAFEKVKELYGADKFEGENAVLTVDDMPQSLWVELKDPERVRRASSARSAASTASPACATCAATSSRSSARSTCCCGSRSRPPPSWCVAALLLVANTIRLAAFARRKEIGIMRLVGASTLYIALPFLLEALVTAFLGVLLATGALAAFMYFGIEQRGQDTAEVHPVDRDGGVRRRRGRRRGPRSAAHRASDTRADAQIPQSLSPRGLPSTRSLPRTHVRLPGAILPPYRPQPHGRSNRCRCHCAGHPVRPLAHRRCAPTTTSRTGRSRSRSRSTARTTTSRSRASSCARPAARLTAAQGQLVEARTALATAQGKLAVAQERDAAAAAELAEAEAALRPGPGRGRGGRGRRRRPSATSSATRSSASTPRVTPT